MIVSKFVEAKPKGACAVVSMHLREKGPYTCLLSDLANSKIHPPEVLLSTCFSANLA